MLFVLAVVFVVVLVVVDVLGLGLGLFYHVALKLTVVRFDVLLSSPLCMLPT